MEAELYRSKKKTPDESMRTNERKPQEQIKRIRNVKW